MIAYQIRQSFKPREIEPEEANHIGYELAMSFTKGNHAFIVATHTDRAHIHNHVIFNSTNLLCDGSFKNFWKSVLALQRISDIICLQHGLSVISPIPFSERTHPHYYEGKLTVRDRIRKDLDEIIDKHPKNTDDLIKLLQGMASFCNKVARHGNSD